MLMDPLTLFGLFAVTAMVVFYALERRSSWFILTFAGACALGSVYGFLQGAWPFGLVEAIWTLVAVWRWWRVKTIPRETESTKTEEEAEKNPPSPLPSIAGGEGNPEKTVREIILNAIRTKGKTQRRDLLPLVTVSKSTLVRLLDKMEAEGLVAQVGERKASYYVLK